ncbi:MAG TPA: hypothetical protein VNL71_12475 [Chloroflexota bacterium]|nr:hypothetical protein [Chloroflexota bacterium]
MSSSEAPRRRFSTWVMALCLVLVCAQGVFVFPRAVRGAGSSFVFFEKFPPNNPRQWNLQRLPDGSRTYLASGAYNIVRTKPGTMRGWPLGVKVPTGFQFNVKLRVITGTDPYVGVSFWDDLADQFVLFAITPDGTAGLFRRNAKGFTSIVYWKQEKSIHTGLGATNSLAVNLDPVSAAKGRTFLINGVPLGAPCHDSWRKALGTMPVPPTRGFFVGVVAGAFADSHAVRVQVLVASMYDGTHAGPVPTCH